MGEIYRQADAVDIWLGEPGYVSRIDKSLLCCPESAQITPYVVIRDARQTFRAARKGRFLDDPNFFSFFVCNDAQRFEKALSLTRPRWQDRGWVIQEFVLAKCVYVCAGSARKMWEGSGNDFTAVEPIIHTFANRYPNLEGFMRRMTRLTECIPKSLPYPGDGEEYGANLFQTYHLMRDTVTTEPQDKIHCLRGILKKRDVAHLPIVNYSMTVVEVFARATWAFLTTAPTYAHIGGNNFQRSFDVFALVTFGNERLPGLPSWCIDFSQLQAVSGRVDNKASLFCSNNESMVDNVSACLPHIIDTDLALVVFGYVPDSIVNICRLALPLHAEYSHMQENSFAMDEAEVQNYAQCILLFARKASTRSKRNVKSRVSPFTRLEYGPQLLDKLEAISLFRGKHGEYRSFGKACTHSCMKHSLSRLLTIYVRALGSSLKDFEVSEYLDYCGSAGGKATLFATTTGLLGLTPSSIEGNDIIVARPCSRVAMLLRPDRDKYVFRGLVYLSGFGSFWGNSGQRSKPESFLIS